MPKRLKPPKLRLRKPKLSKILLGIDEVGRGPWAGPLVVGAVLLGPNFPDDVRDQLTDSKKLTAKKRETLNQLILDQAAATGLGWVSATEIDRYGLGPALKLAARRAVKQILTTCKTQNTAKAQTSNPKDSTETPSAGPEILKFDEIIIDGTINLLADTPLAGQVTLLKKADLLVKEVSAASIIAKVARDRYMTELADRYPGYGFEKHVGYGTAAHQAALRDLGPCPEHRRSFRPIQNLLNAGNSCAVPLDAAPASSQPQTSTASRTLAEPKHFSTTDLGQTAESIVADHLTQQGHDIIARNFKTKTYEIDLISRLGQTIYFTEVKYRKTSRRGSPLASITIAKQKQMRYAAEAFLATHPEFRTYDTKLAVAAVIGPEFTFQEWFALD